MKIGNILTRQTIRKSMTLLATMCSIVCIGVQGVRGESSTTYTYDENGRLISAVQDSSRLTQCHYDDANNVTRYRIGDDLQDKDSDGDGLTDTEEATLGTNPLSTDSDGDGFDDFTEHTTDGMDPTVPLDDTIDTDGDGVPDRIELLLGLSITSPDSDGDGLGDGTEINQLETNPLLIDTDGDGLSDLEDSRYAQLITAALYNSWLNISYKSLPNSLMYWGKEYDPAIGYIYSTPMVREQFNANARMVDGGIEFSMVLHKNGYVYSWGRNIVGELGRGSYGDGVYDMTPDCVVREDNVRLNSILSIAIGQFHTLAVDRYGKVWAWGYNAEGQCGIESSQQVVSRAVKVPGPEGMTGSLSDIISVDAGHHFSVALKRDGTVWLWGQNDDLDLDSYKPVQVPGIGGTGVLSDVIAISAGQYHMLALLRDGTVVSWGNDGSQQLGRGDTSASHLYPERVLTAEAAPALSEVIDIAAGIYGGMALKVDGTVWAWGDDSYGQLGNGDADGNTGAPYPVQTLITDVCDISGQLISCAAIQKDGTVWAWGANEHAQGGQVNSDGSYVSSEQVPFYSSPVQVSLPDYTILQIKKLNPLSKDSDGDGMPDGWEVQQGMDPLYDGDGEADWDNDGWSNSEEFMAGTDKFDPDMEGRDERCVVDIADTFDQHIDSDGDGLWNIIERLSPKRLGIGFNHSMVLKDDGTLWSAGKNDYYLGDHSLTEVIAVESAYWYNIAILNDGTVWTWGRNDGGQLGLGYSDSESHWPEPVVGLNNIVDIAGGFYHAMALDDDGNVYAWGGNTAGQIGNGLKNGTIYAPTKNLGLPRITAIDAGGWHSIALAEDGSVWIWGSNENGQLGLGDSTSEHTNPEKIIGLSDIIQIASERNHTLALSRDGIVYAWGNNENGQIGNNSTDVQLSPVAVLENVIQIAAGRGFSLALDSDGKVWSWGMDDRGQLGNGSEGATLIPTVIGLDDVVLIEAGSQHALAVDMYGAVYAWGANSGGKSGLSGSDHHAPATISELTIHAYISDPTLLDTDADTLNDAWEIAHKMPPNLNDLQQDFDIDGLTTAQELELGTLPYEMDSDHDNLTDADEYYTRLTDPLNADTDGDGLVDGYEVNVTGTDPLDPDSDDDGWVDGN